MHRSPEGHNRGWGWGVCMGLVPLCSFLSHNEAENTFHRLLMHRLEMDYKYTRLDYCNALLAGLPSNTIKPLQMIQNAAARLVFNEPKITHVTPLSISLHWLPVAAHIKFKTLMLAYRTTTGSALLPLTITNLHPLQKSEIC